MLKNQSKKSISNQVITLIIIIGIILRLQLYLENRAFWIDELSIVFNLEGKTLIELLTEPLDLRQNPPPLFIALTKILCMTFGYSGYTYRLLPLLSGIASLFVFYKIANRFFQKHYLSLSLLLFSILPPFIYYSTEAKQYSLSILFSLLIILYSIKCEESNFSNKDVCSLAFIGATGIWLSHSLIITLFSSELTMLFLRAKDSSSNRFKKLCLIGITWGISFLFYYQLSLSKYSNDNMLFYFWSWAFLKFPPDEKTIDLLLKSFAFLKFTKAYIAFTYFFFGFFYFLLSKNKYSFFLISPILVTVLLSSFNIYPFANRTILFLAPSALILIVKGTSLLFQSKRKLIQNWNLAIVLLLISYPIYFTFKNSCKPVMREDLRPILEYVSKNKKKSDLIYVNYFTQFPFKYYGSEYSFNTNFPILKDWDYQLKKDLLLTKQDLYKREGYNDIYIGKLSEFSTWDKKTIRKEINDLKGRRVWFLYSHGANIEAAILNPYLDEVGTKLDHYTIHGHGFLDPPINSHEKTSTYLYDLRK